MTATVSERRSQDGLPHPWPADRYEVRCERESPFTVSRDRYHFAKNAVESAKALERAGLARRVVVVRLEDERVIYDRVGDISLPPESW
ncbi:hypothetical protein GCM10009530_18890 [Microbispora corallina]|uniref:DUF2188 domain-containing protein n=1 Tax=Microbispora corallina TaxID=83302 RepID=A0ABQ4FUG0_9ACTN|nr:MULTISPECIES: hypothetical protein [Microbispora]ETK32599.1 hypothetical protein MPTA5024_28880 [Microbispora sp. ATCC PTA-5024]GIH38452.1 hypothetical protein Mco01_14520 [Microbispora corallina]